MKNPFKKIIYIVCGLLAFYIIYVVYKSTYYVDVDEMRKIRIMVDMNSAKDLFNDPASEVEPLEEGVYRLGIDILKERYIKPLRDPWGNDYLIEKNSEGVVRVVTYGKDNQPNGEGEDKDIWLLLKE